MTGFSPSRPVAWAGIYAATLFLFANIKTTEAGVGYLFLAVALGCAVLVVAGRRDLRESPALRRSTLPLLAFVTYFVFKLLTDLGGADEMRSYAMATSGGLIFALAFGLSVSVLIVGTFNDELHGARRAVLPCVFMWLCVAMAAYTMKAHLADVRSDVFLVQGRGLVYQRPANFAIMIVLVASAQLAHAALELRRSGFSLTLLLAIAGYLMMIGILAMTAQLLGSNTGFVVTGMLGLATLAWIWRPDLSRLRRQVIWYFRPLPMRKVARKCLPRILFNLVLLAVLAGGLGLAAAAYAGIGLGSFRIFGFESGGLAGSSLSSRFELLRHNFLDQFAINPVLGHLKADTLTTGSGTYAHSLISLLSHMGVVGTMLFLAYVATLYRELGRSRAGGSLFYTGPEFAVFRLVMIAGLLGFAVIGAFFTWMPLWFALGLLFPPIVFRSAPGSRRLPELTLR